jgi:hypothetical protein
MIRLDDDLLGHIDRTMRLEPPWPGHYRVRRAMEMAPAVACELQIKGDTSHSISIRAIRVFDHAGRCGEPWSVGDPTRSSELPSQELHKQQPVIDEKFGAFI